MKSILLAVAGSALLLTACAGVEGVFEDPAVARGRAFYDRECSRCHALAGESPVPTAPNLATIRLRYNSLSLERELDAISSIGHYDMPVLHTDPSDRKDIIAFIESRGP